MDNRLTWIVLQRLPETGPATLHNLLHHFGDINAIRQAPHEQLAQCLTATALEVFEGFRDRGEDSVAGKRATQDLVWMDQNQARLLTYDQCDYPDILRQIHHPPPVLMVAGDIRLLAKKSFAIVGSRKCSPSGVEHAAMFAAELAACGFVITSGLASGIDGAAHQGALSAGGSTVAVIATGIDLCYPAKHIDLSNQIKQHGAIVSEFPLGTKAQKENFPRRNRIISGLSVGVLVVEAEEKSGSLITARYAMEQNREVFAIPGAIHNPGSRGCHRLIREGAKLVENIDDILSELNHPFGQIDVEQARPAIKFRKCEAAVPERWQQKEVTTEEEKRFLDFVDSSVVTIDQLARRSGLPVDRAQAMLMALEIKGWVEPLAEGYRRT